MDVAASDLNPRDVYFMMGSCIIPRPIAWISTCAADGTLNLAPFSFFMGVGSKPPMLAVSIGFRSGEPKDTARNIAETREFVVNLSPQSLRQQMVQSSADYGPEVNEFEAVGLTPVASAMVGPPGIAESPIRMECRLHEILRPCETNLILGEIVHFHVDDAVVKDGLADPEACDPTCRLGGQLYAAIADVTAVPRPSV